MICLDNGTNSFIEIFNCIYLKSNA